MEGLMGNQGLIHLAENICDYLDDGDLVKVYSVSKTCKSFVEDNYGRKRLIQKLDAILARKDYCVTKQCVKAPGTLLERYPRWKKICEAIKANASFPALKLFVEKVDEYGDLMRKVIDGFELPNGCKIRPQQPRDPLELMIRMGDYKIVKLLLTHRLGNFSNAFLYLHRTVKHWRTCLEIKHGVWETVVSDASEWSKCVKAYVPLQCQVFELLMDDQLAGWTGLDINAKKYGKYNQTIFHHAAPLWMNGHVETGFVKFLFDNIERIDVHAKDDNGRTALNLLVERSGRGTSSGYSDLVPKLEVWITKCPELFNLDIFKKMSRSCLVTMLSNIYYKPKRTPAQDSSTAKYDKYFVDYLNSTLHVPKKYQKDGWIHNWLESKVKKEKLEEVTWKYYKDRIEQIEDPQPPTKKKRI